MDDAGDSDHPDCENPQLDDNWAGMRRVADRALNDVEAMADALLPRLLASIPAYQKTPLHELRAAVITNMRGAVVGLAERRPPTQSDLAENYAMIEARVQQRLPLEAILEALRIGGQFLWQRFESDARREGVDPDIILAGAQIMWNRNDILMTGAAVSFRRSELALVRHDQQRQSDFLRDLLLGEPDEAELSTLAPAFGLSVDRDYFCFRARATKQVPLQDLRRAVTAAVPDAHAGLLGIIYGDLVGVLPGIPKLKDSTITIGIGPGQRLSAISSSFLLASRALETALAYGMPGVFRVEDLALRAAVMAEDHVGAILIHRYLRPLDAEKSSAGTLETTLREFLSNGMRIDQTARALYIHPNTLRNRLHRFQELTGASLNSIEDIVGTWWALQRQRLESVTERSRHQPEEPRT